MPASISEGGTFINAFGIPQTVPEGYYFNWRTQQLAKNTPTYERSKKLNDTETDYYGSTAVKTGADYVEFYLSGDTDNNRNHVVCSAQRAFGITRSQAQNIWVSGEKIICRPDQFARFLIYRAEGVAINQFASLKARLLPSKPQSRSLDVRAN